MTTGSPGFQLTGVAILYLQAFCKDSTALRTSSTFRPVHAGGDDVEGTRGKVLAGGVLLVGIDHVQLLDDAPLGIGGDWIVHPVAVAVSFDVLDPFPMGVKVVGGDSQQFHASGGEFVGVGRHHPQLRRANRSEIAGVREYDGEGITDVVVELDPSLSRLHFQIRQGVSDCESRHSDRRLRTDSKQQFFNESFPCLIYIHTMCNVGCA